MKNIVLPCKHPESKLPAQEVIDWIVDNLLRKEKVIVGQNLVYDFSRLMRASSGGARAIKCFGEDSMVYHFFLDEASLNRTLEYLVGAFTSIGKQYKSDVDVTKLEQTPLAKVARYNGIDSYAPIEVIQTIRGELEERNLYSPQAVKLYQRLVPYAACLESSGIKVDLERLLEVEGDLLEERFRFEKELKALAPGVNLNSTQQLSDFIFGEEGLALPIPDIKDVYNEDGRPSTRKDVLRKLEHPFVSALSEYKKVSKILSYIRGDKGNSIIENLEEDGFVYPNFHIVKHRRGGSVTRFAVNYPPMQNIPRDSETRSCFVSRYPKGFLAELDGSQMELRYAAVWSQDPTLVSLFAEGVDIHQATADFCGVSRDDPGGINGKNINFGLVYGITIPGLMEKFNLSFQKAKQINSSVKAAYPKLFEALEEVKQEATRTGQVFTPYGIRRKFSGATPSTPLGRALLREAANFGIQRAASDMVQLLGWYLMIALDGLALPVMSSHDGLLFDFRQEDLKKVLDKMRQGVQHFPQLVEEVLDLDVSSVPFVFDIKIGKNWKHMEKLENGFQEN